MDSPARSLPHGAVHQRGHAVLGQRAQHLGVLGRALLDDRAVGADHPGRGLAVAEDRAQLVEIAVADHLPELTAVRRVGQRKIHVPHARQFDVRALQLLVGRIAEVEDRVEPQGGEERGVLLRGVGEVAAAEQVPVAHSSAVRGGQATHVAEVAHSAELGLGRRDLLGHGGSPHSAMRRRRAGLGVAGRQLCAARALDDTTWVPEAMSCPQASPPGRGARVDIAQ